MQNNALPTITPDHSPKHGQWYVLAAAMLWGTTGTTQALAPEGASPLALGMLRLGIGGLGLLAYAIASGAARGAFQRRNEWPRLATLVAAVSIAAYQLLFFAGVKRTGVAVGTIVGIGSAPILGGAIAYLILGEHPGRRWLAATILAISGSSLLVAAGSSIQLDRLGILLAIGAGGAYALFTVVSKLLLEKQPAPVVMAVVFCLGAIMAAPLLLDSDLSWLAQPRGLAVAVHLGLIATTLAYVLFARGLTVVPASTAVTLTLAEPLTAGILGLAVLRERVTPVAVLGILLVFSGLAILSTGRPGARGQNDYSQSRDDPGMELKR